MADESLSRLTDDEKEALVALLKRAIDADRYPLSPRIYMLKGILAKLEPPKPASLGAREVDEIFWPTGDARQHGRGGRPDSRMVPSLRPPVRAGSSGNG